MAVDAQARVPNDATGFGPGEFRGQALQAQLIGSGRVALDSRGDLTPHKISDRLVQVGEMKRNQQRKINRKEKKKTFNYLICLLQTRKEIRFLSVSFVI